MAGDSVNVSCQNTPQKEVISTEAIMSSAITSFHVRTSRDTKTSTNSGPQGTNEIENVFTDITGIIMWETILKCSEHSNCILNISIRVVHIHVLGLFMIHYSLYKRHIS